MIYYIWKTDPMWVTDVEVEINRWQGSDTNLAIFVTGTFFLFCHQFFGLKKKPEFKKDFTTDENMILQYDDYNQLAEAGQQIIALVQAGCKSRRNTANAGEWPHLTPILTRLWPQDSNWPPSDPL